MIGRIAQRPGDRTALGFIGAQIDAQIFGLVAESGGQTQIIALAVQAVGVDVGGLDALARNRGVAAEGPAAVFLGEAFQQFDIGAEAVDVDGDGLRPARFARRLKLGTAQQADLARADFRCMEAPRQQRPVGPVDADVGRFQPDALFVGHGDALQTEVVEQIALKSLDVDPAVAADLLTRDEAGDQFAPRVGHQIHPSAHQGDDDKRQQTGEGHARDEGSQLQTRALALGLLGRRIGDVCAHFVRRRCVGQNAWPMLR